MNNLFFDLDGTVIDSKTRLHRLFCDLVPEASGMVYDDYWAFKFSGMRHEDILGLVFGYDDLRIRSFCASWMALVEAPQYLALDCAFPWTCESLARLAEHDTLYLVTDRQNAQAVWVEITGIGLNGYFRDVLVTERKRTKAEMIRKVGAVSPADWLVGDTGHDVLTGKELGVQTCSVLSGFMDRRHLGEYAPDLVVPHIGEFCRRIVDEGEIRAKQ